MLINDIRKQVTEQCANYDKEGLCLLETGAGGCRRCPFFNGQKGDKLPRCLYYENAVLPDDEKLKARYWQSFGLAYWGDKREGTLKACKRCENPFDPGESPKRQYCDECREQQRKEKRNKRMRDYRQKQVKIQAT